MWIFPLAIDFALAAIVFSEQRIVEGPTDTNVRLGETVVLKCRVEGQQGAVQWVKNGFGLGSDRVLSVFPRYSMEGSTSKGEYNLKITEVEIDDDDSYECQIEAAGSNPTRTSNPAKLSVLVEPHLPKLSTEESTLKAVAGRVLQQSCTSKEGKPPAKLGWAIVDDSKANKVISWLGDSRAKFISVAGKGNVQISQPARVVEGIHRTERRTYTVTSNISFTPQAEDDEKYLACLVQHPTSADVNVVSVRLDLNYAPKVTVKLDSNSKMRESSSALLSCSVKAKPFENVEISWFRNGKLISSATTDTLSFPELRMDHHQSEYRCVARNTVGESSDAIKLNVSYGAHIMSTEQHQAVSAGENVFFQCDAIGNPTPSIYWKKVGDDQIIARGSNLTIESVHSWQRGEYECVAAVEGFKPARLMNYLHIKGPPTVVLAEEMVASIGEHIELVCEVRGRPQPQDVIWSSNGQPLEHGRLGGRMQVLQVPRQYGVESKLVIQALREGDFGSYNCTAYNELGTSSQVVVLKKKSILDTITEIVPPSYAVPAVFAFTLLFLVIFFCALWKFRQNGYRNNASRFNDEHSDVTVKCEALDGGQFFPEMYSSAALENHEMMCSKDYMSVPQSNPDLDYLPPPNFPAAVYSPYYNQPIEYAVHDGTRFDPGYESYASGLNTPAGTVTDMYGYSCSKLENAPLETLTEVATPDTESGTPLLLNAMGMHDRPISRTSTHV